MNIVQPKTIHIQRKRKINPELISKKFEYMSEEVGRSIWVDIPEDADIDQITAELTAYINTEIAVEVEQITAHYRKIARAQNVYYGEIEPAFYELMKSQNMSEAEIAAGFEQFKNLLEAEMAKRSI